MILIELLKSTLHDEIFACIGNWIEGLVHMCLLTYLLMCISSISSWIKYYPS